MIRCVAFRAHAKNTLKGFADLELSRVGLVLRDCSWHEKNGHEWVAFPARAYEGTDGTTKWSPLIEFSPGASRAREQFRREAVAAIRAYAFAEQEG